MDPNSQRLIQGAAGAAVEKIYVEDVFSTYLYTGNSSTQTITNGIDLAGEGGLVWCKRRSSTGSHGLFDTERGIYKTLYSDFAYGQDTLASTLTAFNSNGFALSTNAIVNASPETYASWTFRKAEKFFDVVTYTGNGTSLTVNHNLGTAPGCIIVKRTNSTSDWAVYHRSLATNEYLLLNSTAAKDLSSNTWNNTAATSTVFSVGSDVNTNFNGQPYVAYLFAHDAGGFGDSGNDSVIKCGTFNDSSAGTVNLGWEPQWILYRSTAAGNNWNIFDNMRGWPASGNSQYLWANSSIAESGTAGVNTTSTGFSYPGYGAGDYIYIAIRRGPMKTPTDATTVFNVSANTYFLGGGPTKSADMILLKGTNSDSGSTALSGQIADKLRGYKSFSDLSGNVNNSSATPYLIPTSTGSEVTTNSRIGTGPAASGFDGSFVYGAVTGWPEISVPQGYSATGAVYTFTRAPGFFDVTSYIGNGSGLTSRAIDHNLGAIPELIIVKVRSSSDDWIVYHSSMSSSGWVRLNTADAKLSGTVISSPSTTQFRVTDQVAYGGDSINQSGQTYIAYLFASCPGISKVGSYTGTGTTLQINCGFTNGARFVMIKRTDSTGDWYVWDTARGIVSGNDPYLLLNSTAVQVTNTDYIDPYSAGFEISSTAPAAINANGGSYIFLAIA